MLVVFLVAVLSGLLYFRPREMKERAEWKKAWKPEDESDTATAS
jgi:ESS family glutamate:Na+ symporter